jgi:hypothetical protein
LFVSGSEIPIGDSEQFALGILHVAMANSQTMILISKIGCQIPQFVIAVK